MHEILQFVFIIFLASFNKRQGGGPEFQIFVKLSVKSQYIIGFSRIPRYHQKRSVLLCVFSENAPFNSAYSPKTHSSTYSLNTLYPAESSQFYFAFLPTTISLTPRFRQKAKFDSAFSPKTLKTIQKRTVTKTALNLTPCFRRQRSAMLRAFGENGE